MPETSKKLALEVPAPTPSITAQGTSSAAGIGNNRAEGVEESQCSTSTLSIYAPVYTGGVGKGAL